MVGLDGAREWCTQVARGVAWAWGVRGLCTFYVDGGAIILPEEFHALLVRADPTVTLEETQRIYTTLTTMDSSRWRSSRLTGSR